MKNQLNEQEEKCEKQQEGFISVNASEEMPAEELENVEGGGGCTCHSGNTNYGGEGFENMDDMNP